MKRSENFNRLVGGKALQFIDKINEFDDKQSLQR